MAKINDLLFENEVMPTEFEETWHKIKFKEFKYVGVKINVCAEKNTI